jgi:hypothetical protein
MDIGTTQWDFAVGKRHWAQHQYKEKGKFVAKEGVEYMESLEASGIRRDAG